MRLFEFISFFANHGLFLFACMFLVFMSGEGISMDIYLPPLRSVSNLFRSSLAGSALSNQIAFGYYIESYASFQTSFFTTMKAVQGKLPYEDISNMMQR